MSSESEPKPCTYLPGCWVVTAEGWVDHQPTEEAARGSLRARLGGKEPLTCNAEGIPHEAHEWDFGGDETFWCVGTPSVERCQTCAHPEGYDRLSGPCPTCNGDGAVPRHTHAYTSEEGR